MGDVIADAMLEATKPTDFGGAVAAFMNSGGVRAGPALQPDLRRRAAGQVTYGEAFTVQPFGNTLVVKTCTGQRSTTCSNQQFNNPRPGRTGSCSSGERPTTSGTRRRRRRSSPGRSTSAASGRRQRPTASSMNNFMADGGDGYTVFRDQCTDPLGGEVDLDAFAGVPRAPIRSRLRC